MAYWTTQLVGSCLQGVRVAVAVNTPYYGLPSRATLDKCLSEHLCKHVHPTRVSQRVADTQAGPLIPQSCQRKCKHIPSFPNESTSSEGQRHLQALNTCPPILHPENTHRIFSMCPLDYSSQ